MCCTLRLKDVRGGDGGDRVKTQWPDGGKSRPYNGAEDGSDNKIARFPGGWIEYGKLVSSGADEFFYNFFVWREERLEPWSSMRCLRLKPVIRRETVSREVPIISAISSWVRVRVRTQGNDFPRRLSAAFKSRRQETGANFSYGWLARLIFEVAISGRWRSGSG